MDFDHDVRYLKMCSYKREASAVGAAKHYPAGIYKKYVIMMSAS